MQHVLGPQSVRAVSFVFALATALALPSSASASRVPGEDLLDVALPAVYIAGGAALVTLQAVDLLELNRFPVALAPVEAFVYGLPLTVVGALRLADHDYAWGTLALSSGIWFASHAVYVTARPEPRRTRLSVAITTTDLGFSLQHAF